MAKYCKTGMDFFYALKYRVGMYYYRDIIEMAEEEAEQTRQSRATPPQQLDAVRSMYGGGGGGGGAR
jgi:hypothetical protein